MEKERFSSWESSSRCARRRAVPTPAYWCPKPGAARAQDDVVTHHASGQRFGLRDYLDGVYEVIG